MVLKHWRHTIKQALIVVEARKYMFKIIEKMLQIRISEAEHPTWCPCEIHVTFLLKLLILDHFVAFFEDYLLIY